MKTPGRLGGAVALVAVSAAVFASVRMTEQPMAVAPLTADSTPQTDSPGMCPWRNPKADMSAFFPSATHYEQRLLVLSSLRAEVSKALGPGSLIDANGIYYYRVYHAKDRVGSVIAQRVPGEYGVVEYVTAFDNAGKICGVKIQRQREPDETAHAITSTSWLHAFDGRDENSGFNLGSDIPNVNQDARVTAQSLTDSIRRLTIEYDIAHVHGQ